MWWVKRSVADPGAFTSMGRPRKSVGRASMTTCGQTKFRLNQLFGYSEQFLASGVHLLIPLPDPIAGAALALFRLKGKEALLPGSRTK